MPRNIRAQIQKIFTSSTRIASTPFGKTKAEFTLASLLLHHPINRHNMQRIEAIADLATQAGCSGVSLSPFYLYRAAMMRCFFP